VLIGDIARVKLPKPPTKGWQQAKTRLRQPGHEQRLRTPFSPKAVNEFVPCMLDRCPDGGGSPVPSRRVPEMLQQA
jgi:hypothetical protein